MSRLTKLSIASTVSLIAILWIQAYSAQVDLVFDPENGGAAFAAGDIKTALVRKGDAVTDVPLSQVGQSGSDTRIVLVTLGDNSVVDRFVQDGGTVPTGLQPEGFAIRPLTQGNKTSYWVLGSDLTGIMYGGLEIAETVRLDGLTGVREEEQNPHLPKRGLKLNIPLDARTPSYSDAGSAAQANIPEMWSWDFWTGHLDNCARHRFNTITLWSLHHFPSIVKVPEYPDVALDDVKRSTINWKEWFPDYENEGSNIYNQEAMNSLETLKQMTIDEKIAFWRNVMEYARDRGVEFHLITWNVFISSAAEHYGLTRSMNNSTTIDYIRKSVRSTFQTYPLLGGVGVTAGEGMPGAGADEKEDWLWKTYGEGLMDAKRGDQTDRKYRFIHRYWWSNIPAIMSHFDGMDDDVVFDFSFKYNRARLYSGTNPNFANGALSNLPEGMKFWWNLRNDDIFNFRWGDPDYVREFINNFPPLNQTLGFHMGSDGYVWGREFTSTEPESPRQLEMEKHWYKFMLWGRLGYDPGLTNAHFEKVIQSRFPQVSGTALMEIWQRASKIIPAVNRNHWHDWDFQWAVEYCRSRFQFHDINENQWNAGRTAGAAEIKGHADYVLNNIGDLRGSGGKQLRLTLGDLEAMAHLGNYYAEKMLAADNKNSNRSQAAVHLTNAAGHWRRYAAVAGSQYAPQLLGRAGWGDWKELYREVLNDISLVNGSDTPPSLPATPGGAILEAETAELQDVRTQSSATGFTGTGYVSVLAGNPSITWTFDAPQAGEYILEFRYILDQGDQDMPVAINGQPAGAINFWSTGSSSSWAWDRKTVTLNQGGNVIELTVAGADPEVDHVNILYSGAPVQISRPVQPGDKIMLQSLSSDGVVFHLTGPNQVRVQVYTLAGRTVCDIAKSFTEPGTHQILMKGRYLHHGVYIFRMKAGSQSIQKRLLVLK